MSDLVKLARPWVPASMAKLLQRLQLLAALFLLALPAAAHKSSDSYLAITMVGAQAQVQWDIALRDIHFAIGLDGNGDDQITWGELRGRQAELEAWALSRLALQRGGDCALKPQGLQVDEHTDGGYAVLSLAGVCPGDAGPLSLQYRLLFDLDSTHRGLLKLDLEGVLHSAVLGPQSGTPRFTGSTSAGAQFLQYVMEGIWHIWIGFDHILFLLALLLPAVLIPGRELRGVSRFAEAFKPVLWVVTGFTVAHSITLSLAALEIVSLPSRWVESAIAASVAFAAANNLLQRVHGRWRMASLFGLIHGFGFASVLAELGLPAGAMGVSLLGFNLGVELGQLAIVALFLPLAFWLRHTAFYRRVVLVGGSWAALVVALAWFVERAFELSLFWWL